ncbi:hypothetical protein ACFYSW_27460 [Rhodococcus aetherivorans]|uniref:hypothetical protein n=1 Tax=Rhodococcus aetherivorans TaxID=191292 RepID=UPI00368A6D70
MLQVPPFWRELRRGEVAMAEKLLLDEFLPTYDHAICVSRVFRAPPREVFDAVTNLNLFELPLTRVLLEARALPGHLADARARRRGLPRTPEPPTFRIRDLPERGWIVLGERPGIELVCGQVGKVWKGAGGMPDRPVTAGDFAASTSRALRSWRKARWSCPTGQPRAC